MEASHSLPPIYQYTTFTYGREMYQGLPFGRKIFQLTKSKKLHSHLSISNQKPISNKPSQINLNVGGALGCPNIGVLVNQAGPVDSFDYSNGTNPTAGTYNSTAPYSTFLLVLRASDGGFVRLVDFGETAWYAGDVKVDKNTCDFFLFVYPLSVQRGVCYWPEIPGVIYYKLMVNVDQNGNIVDTPLECISTSSPTPSITSSTTRTVSPSTSSTATVSLTVTPTLSITSSTTGSVSPSASQTTTVSFTVRPPLQQSRLLLP